MSHSSKKHRRAIAKQWQAQQLAELRTTMPLSPEQLHKLLDCLDADPVECDSTTRLTAAFLAEEGLDVQKVLDWLAEQGGCCDCEVQYNLDSLDRMLHPPPNAPPANTTKQKSQPRDLTNVAGWDLTILPPPWRVANLYRADEPIMLQLGKKAGCTVAIIDAGLSPGDQTDDEYWRQLWHARVREDLGQALPDRGPLRVSHTLIKAPAGLRATVVQAPAWTPVYGWIVPSEGNWHLEIRTESTRAAGDFPQVGALLHHLAGQV